MSQQDYLFFYLFLGVPCTSLVLRLTSIPSNKEHKCFDSVNIPQKNVKRKKTSENFQKPFEQLSVAPSTQKLFEMHNNLGPRNHNKGSLSL